MSSSPPKTCNFCERPRIINTDLIVKGDLCVHGDITVKRSRFHGWWQILQSNPLNSPKYLAGSRTNQQTPIVFIDTSEYDQGTGPIKITNYAGTVSDYRVPTNLDSLVFESTLPATTEIIEDGRVLKNIRPGGVPGYNFVDSITIQENGSLVSDDPDFPYAVIGAFDSNNVFTNNGFLQSETGLLKKIKDPPFPIRPFGEDAGFIDANNRQYMFNQAIDHWVKIEGSILNKELQFEEYIGDQAAADIRNQLLTVGIQHPAFTVHRILKTIGGSAVTIIETTQYHRLNVASTVTVSGLSGSWSVLNGEHDLLVGSDFTSGGVFHYRFIPIYDKDAYNDYVDVPNLRYRFSLPIDTSSLPDYDSTVHGLATITPGLHGPVTPDCTYRQFIASVLEFYSSVIRVGAHSVLRVLTESYGATSNVVHTWDEAKQLVASVPAGGIPPGTNVGSSNAGNDLISRYESGHHPSYYYNNPFWYFIITGISRPINEPWQQLRLDFGVPEINYIPLTNYMASGPIRYVYWRVDPNTPQWASSSTTLQSVFGGSLLESIVSAESPLAGGVPSYTSAFNTFGGLSAQFFISAVDPDYCAGKRVAYIRADTYLTLVGSNALHTPYFSPQEGVTYPNYGVAGPGLFDKGIYGRWVAIAKFINGEADFEGNFLFPDGNGGGYKADEILWDNRANAGGNSRGLELIFGGSREVSNPVTTFKNQNCRTPIFGSDASIEMYQGYTEDDSLPRGGRQIGPQFTKLFEIDADEIKEFWGENAMIQNIRVNILTSTAAVSGGDLFVDYLLNVGGGVITRVFGDVDGRNDGVDNFAGAPVTVSKENNEFLGSDGLPATPIYYQSAGATNQLFNGKSTVTRVDKPNLIPVETYSSRLDNTVYPDFGEPNSLPHPRGPFFDKGDPVLGDGSTYRDSWFEATLENICPVSTLNALPKSIKAKKRNVDSSKLSKPLHELSPEDLQSIREQIVQAYTQAYEV